MTKVSSKVCIELQDDCPECAILLVNILNKNLNELNSQLWWQLNKSEIADDGKPRHRITKIGLLKVEVETI